MSYTMERCDDADAIDGPYEGPWLSLWRGPMPGAPSGRAMKDIATEIAASHGLSLDDMRGPSRLRNVSRARQHVMYALVSEKRWSLQQIGTVLGNRDHSTVHHGATEHAARLAAEVMAEAA